LHTLARLDGRNLVRDESAEAPILPLASKRQSREQRAAK